ncbi:MAG: hypothetical protein ABSG57_14385 [Candidatus Bathyarchaeia archaeon]|jgi:uncharacterized Fe-S cluster-containing MiaB family protein
MSNKICAWCGQDIVNEIGSIEVRIFFRTGKRCRYYDSMECVINEYKAQPATLMGEV